MQTFYTNERNVQIVLYLLKANGIRKVVASPGTTNITLVASMQQDSFFEIYSSVDERSAAYLACGLAAESGEPVVLSCTGATASRNYMSGLTEAYYRKLPVVAITSHQGIHRIGHLIPQNIDRTVVPNDIAKYSVTIPVVSCKNDEIYTEVEVNKALLELFKNGGGPVHINLATSYSKDFSVKILPSAIVLHRHTAFDDLPTLPNGRIGVFVGAHRRFTEKETKAIDMFCASNDAVVFCDHTSGYYGKYRIVFSLPLSQANYSTPQANVNLLIHIGEVSGDYSAFSIRANTVWRINEDGEMRDTFGKLERVFQMPEWFFFNHYTVDGRDRHTYWDECKNEYEKIFGQISELPFGNIWIAQQMAGRLPEFSVLHLGILNTLRSWNFFKIAPHVESYCNVGGFGIDGDLSALIGASFYDKEKLYFGIFGDLAFFYDMNVIGNRHVGSNVRIMLINNGRGTEFRNFNHLASRFGDDADKYMAAAGHYGAQSHQLVCNYAENLGYEYISASSKKDFLINIDRFLCTDRIDKPMLFEVFTNSEDESNALKMVCETIVDRKIIVVDKLKNIAKEVLGENGIQILKTVLGK